MIGVRRIAVPLIFALAIALTGCSGMSKKKKSSGGSDVNLEGQNEGLSLELNADSDSGKAGAIRTVYFDYNSARLRGDTKSTLKANANYLKENKGIEIQVEGHCDERGGVQYNLALGERRAKSVKDYLIALGVSSSRISTISFGKERPVSFGHSEDSWSKNRRGNFVITAK